MPERRNGPSLAVRLALGFVAVALVGVIVVTGAILVTAHGQASQLSREERQATLEQVTRALEGGYAAAGSWSRVDAAGPSAVASRADAVMFVTDSAGRTVLSPAAAGRAPAARHAAASMSAPVVVGGHRVGAVELRFRGALAAPEQRLRDRVASAALVGSLIAIALALAASGFAARRIAGPVHRLTRAARRVQGGDLSARVDAPAAPGEIGELGRAFDRMAGTLEHNEAARRRLVADLSHEVRTPLAILRANVEELVDGVEPATPQRLASLHEEILRLGALVEQLDALAAAETPSRAPRRETVDLAALAEHELEALALQLAGKDLTVERELEPVSATGDRAMLGQVVANLLSNSLKFTPAGGVVGVRLAGAGDAVRLEVWDSGPGVPPAERAHVFDRFWRGTAASGVAGSGIGLAVVGEIVRAHGGRVHVEARPGGGSRFVVDLPRG